MVKRMPASKAVRRTFHDRTLWITVVCFTVAICWLGRNLPGEGTALAALVAAVGTFFGAILRYMFGKPPESGEGE